MIDIIDLDLLERHEQVTLQEFLDIIDSTPTSTLSQLEDIINAEINRRYDYFEE